MPNFDISSPFLREAERLAAIGKGSQQAVTRAVSTLARRLPVDARQDIQNEYSLTATRIRQGLSVRQGDGFVELTGAGRGIGLIEFGGNWGGAKTQGAIASVFASGGSHSYAGTFIATGLSGNRQIFDRMRASPKQRMQKGRYVGQMRQPLKTLYGPSIAQMLRKGDREQRLTDIAQVTLSDEVTRLLNLNG
jgi:hypothetical protein